MKNYNYTFNFEIKQNNLNKIFNMEDVKIIELDGQNHPEDFTIKFVIVGDSGVGVNQYF